MSKFLQALMVVFLGLHLKQKRKEVQNKYKANISCGIKLDIKSIRNVFLGPIRSKGHATDTNAICVFQLPP